MAIAVWNGSEDDRNGRKAVSQFVTLRISPTTALGGGNNTLVLALAAGSLIGLTALGVGLGVYGMKDTRAR